MRVMGNQVPVYKGEIDPAKLPAALQGSKAKEGYRFFAKDARGKREEFYWRGLKNESEYFVLLKDIAEFIIGKLPDVEVRTDGGKKVDSGRTIFLAESARELRDARQRLLNDLVSAGHRVLPDVDRLPGDVQEYAKAVQAALAQAGMAVFFLGEKPGEPPGGSEEPILHLQLRLAREHAAQRPLPRVLWTPKWLPGLPDKKRDPFEVAGRFGGVRSGEELFAEEVTDLSQWLRERLKPKGPPRPLGAEVILVLAVDPADDDLAFDLAGLAQNLGPRVLPVASDEDLPTATTDGPPAALIAWGAARPEAVEACLSRLPSPCTSICLILPGGDENAKRRFFREGLIREKLAVFPADRSAARALLERLELLPKESRP
jgi:hypothetical protein